MSNDNKKRFKIFDTQREGRGVEKGEDTSPTLGFFFKQLGRKFWKLVSVNLIMILQIVPLVIGIAVYTMGPTTPTVMYPTYSVLLGAQTAAPTSVGATMLSAASGLNRIPTADTHVYWVIAILAIIHIFTYGWQKVGSTYIMRNLVRGDGVFIVSDFFYAIKRNFKQGLVLGILDSLIIGLLAVDFIIMLSQPASGINNFMYAAIIALFIMYLFMRMYTYLMLVTFNIKTTKIFKNALIFTILGIKRNLMAALGVVLVVALVAALCFVAVSLSFGLLPVVIILAALIVLALLDFICTYAAYPVIEKYMINAPTPSES